MNEEEKNNQKQQEEAASKKAAGVAAKGAIDYFTAGQGGQVYDAAKKVPIAGEKIDKAEDKLGKAANKATGGKFGKVAKKADDAGALDMADKALSMGKGGQNAGGLGKGSSTNVSGQPPANGQSVPKNVSSSTSQPAPNIYKNGIPGSTDNINENRNSALSKNLSDIHDRRNKADSVYDSDGSSKSRQKSPFNNLFKSKAEQKVFISVEIDSLVKKSILPLVILISFLMILTIVTMAESEDNDLAAVDPEAEYAENQGGSPNYYSNGDPDTTEFYQRVLDTVDNYSSNGKSINAMYITSTYKVLDEYKANISPKKMTQSVINSLADGMLGDSTVYSENTYRKYLKEEFFPNYISEKKIDKAVDRVFERIEQYMDKHHSSSGCTTTTGSNCTYSINGIRGVTNDRISLSNIQVRLMDSSFCNGTDGRPVSGENLIDFEKYVLGVAYGEIGTGFKSEAEKVQLIAARSFALARPYSMNGASGVKYVQENGNNILQIRSCVADQVFCNTDEGCSKNGSSQYYIMHSGTSYPVVYKEKLDNYPNSTLKSSWESTTGMVALDSSGKLVQLGYLSGKQNEWNNLASNGLDYVQIILQTYPEVKEIKKMNCTDTTEKSDSAFLQVAARIWQKMVDGNYSYSQGNSVPPSGNLIDCSTYVSWVLYEYGFKDEFGGPQHDTVSFVNTNWTSKMGWTEISVAAGEDVSQKLQAGDILVRDNGGGNSGHILIVSEVKSNGTIMGYESSSSEPWKSAAAKGGKPVDVTYFAKYQWAGKIIRVSNVSGDSCQTAESGEAINWKQTDEKWKSISLGNSSADIGSYGCFVTSIAIQIARSGVQTTLADFNPGTFVRELNKYSSFDGNGNFNGAANISKIVPSGFSEKYHSVSLSGDAKNKISQIKSYLDQGLYPIMRVKTTNGQHWVAVVGVTDNDVIMADPGSQNTNAFATYSVAECSTLNVYQIG